MVCLVLYKLDENKVIKTRAEINLRPKIQRTSPFFVPILLKPTLTEFHENRPKNIEKIGHIYHLCT
jgi:hypothetical protein